MGFSFHKALFLLASMLVFAGCLFGRTADATPLEDVCRMTFNDYFCWKIFGANMTDASMPALANLAIGDMIDNMNMTRITIEFLLYFSVDPQALRILTQCKNLYAPVFSSLVASAYYNLVQGKNHELGQQAMQAFNAADQCWGAYAAHFLKAPFESYMFDLKRLSQILDVIAVFSSSRGQIANKLKYF